VPCQIQFSYAVFDSEAIGAMLGAQPSLLLTRGLLGAFRFLQEPPTLLCGMRFANARIKCYAWIKCYADVNILIAERFAVGVTS